MQTIYYGLGAVGIICGGIWAVVKGVLWVGVRFASVESKLDMIMTNHLPHIEERLGRLEDRL